MKLVASLVHSPKVDVMMTPDGTRLLSGRSAATPAPIQERGKIIASMDLTAWAGPWRNSFGANLTPDRETGIAVRYDEKKLT